jgi:hypothetical protein
VKQFGDWWIFVMTTKRSIFSIYTTLFTCQHVRPSRDTSLFFFQPQNISTYELTSRDRCAFDQSTGSLSQTVTLDHRLQILILNLSTVIIREHQLLIYLEITRSRKFVIRRFIWITKFRSHIHTLLQGGMGEHGKQGRVGAREGFS